MCVYVDVSLLLRSILPYQQENAPPPSERVVAQAQPVRHRATFPNMRRYILCAILYLVASIGFQTSIEFQPTALSAAFNLSSPIIVRITSSTAAFVWPHLISVSLHGEARRSIVYSVGPIRVDAMWSPKTTTGPEDYASAIAGGRIADVLCSPSFSNPQLNRGDIGIYARLIAAKFKKLPIPYSPSILLSSASSKSWRFAGRAGTLGITFAHEIHISEVALDRPASTMSSGSANSAHALRSVVIWGITNSTWAGSRRECRPVHDNSTFPGHLSQHLGDGSRVVRLTEGQFDNKSRETRRLLIGPSDCFPPVHGIVLEVLDNWGSNEFTSVHRVHAYGRTVA
ncbi:hypothetical protein FA95DRAFT_1296902 [Auriscalpium vulgare]|uniref:Uncharacterized protein n=1 Tax=Auriscalpium vulgare TaxID=40419 RepID=A0ACB8RSL7_9AGAM|nr:hypothetical protein FA95DRAFT_1296902 [Auriscalpium vulgare]